MQLAKSLASSLSIKISDAHIEGCYLVHFTCSTPKGAVVLEACTKFYFALKTQPKIIQPKPERFLNSCNCAFTNTRNLAVMLLARKLILPITNISKKYFHCAFICMYVCIHICTCILYAHVLAFPLGNHAVTSSDG